jgi:hypothetical protein
MGDLSGTPSVEGWRAIGRANLGDDTGGGDASHADPCPMQSTGLNRLPSIGPAPCGCQCLATARRVQAFRARLTQPTRVDRPPDDSHAANEGEASAARPHGRFQDPNRPISSRSPLLSGCRREPLATPNAVEFTALVDWSREWGPDRRLTSSRVTRARFTPRVRRGPHAPHRSLPRPGAASPSSRPRAS